MASKHLKCPSCSRLYSFAEDVRFCEDDGTPLVQVSNEYAENTSHGSSAVSSSGVRSFPFHFESASLMGLGFILIMAGLLLPPFDLSLPSPLPNENKPKRLQSVAEALNSCFGSDIPEIPNPDGTKSEAVFQEFKKITRTLSSSATSGVKVSTQEEGKIGDTVFEAILGREKISEDRAKAERLANVVKKIAAYTPRGAELEFRGVVLSGEMINAAMLPGGHLLVWEGLLDGIASDDQLASIIGHEIAHAELRHHDDVIKFSKAGGKLTSSVLGGLGEDAGSNLGAMGGNIISTVYDQDQEFEADRLGICLAHLAGFEQSSGQAATALEVVEAAALAQTKNKNERKPVQGGAFRVLYDIVNSHPEMKIRQDYANVLAKKLKGN